MRKPNVTKRRLNAQLAVLIALALCLAGTTLALVWSIFSVPDNSFHTGTTAIDLNGGKAVIQEDEFLFEPGMTVEKDFYVQNTGSGNIYYRIYLDGVTGQLADVLDVSILDGDKVLCTGKASDLTRTAVTATDEILKPGQRKELTIRFHMPDSAGSTAQNKGLAFTLCADATQTKNNPDRLFN